MYSAYTEWRSAGSLESERIKRIHSGEDPMQYKSNDLSADWKMHYDWKWRISVELPVEYLRMFIDLKVGKNERKEEKG